jgi:Formyl transferase
VNVALLSGDAASDYTGEIARRLVEQGDDVSAIVVVRVPKARRARLLAARLGLDGIKREIVRRVTGSRDAAAQTAPRGFAPLVAPAFVGSLNGPDAVAALRDARPEVIVYTGGGIVRDELLSIPSIGVLNAHMGLLPGYRGMNALEWSLLDGEPLGVTIHFIDRGIDTGDILLRRQLDPPAGARIPELRTAATRVSADALAEAVRLLREGKESRTPQDGAQGGQYFVMHARLKAIAETRLHE